MSVLVRCFVSESRNPLTHRTADLDSFTIGSVICASSYSVAQIIVGRLILGLGVGGASVIGPL